VTPDVRNDPAQVAAFVGLFQAAPQGTLIRNLTTQVDVLKLGARHFPITLNDAADGPTCYLCCPSAGYIAYAKEETRNFLAHRTLRRAILRLIDLAAPLMRASGLDTQVQVNNWLFSTNPVPQLSLRDAKTLRHQLSTAYPNRAIVLRSLNPLADRASMSALRGAGFRLLPARQVYISRAPTDPATAKQSGHMRADRRLLRNTPYRHAPDASFEGADYARCVALYDMLYLDKYTPLNPQYTAAYIEQMHQSGLLRLEGLRDAAGVLVAVTGLFQNGRTLTQPIVGYDTGKPLRHGLYRMVMAMGQDDATANNLFFNMSAGAGSFKRRRQAMPVIEYTAVYVGHLPLRARMANRVIEGLLRGIGVPLLKGFKL